VVVMVYTGPVRALVPLPRLSAHTLPPHSARPSPTTAPFALPSPSQRLFGHRHSQVHFSPRWARRLHRYPCCLR
jgi:hypothetical protein